MKFHKNITLDLDIIQELRIRGINTSALVNEFFRNYLNLKASQEENDIEKLDASIIKYQVRITQSEVHKKKILDKQQKAARLALEKAEQAKAQKEKEEADPNFETPEQEARRKEKEKEMEKDRIETEKWKEDEIKRQKEMGYI